VLLPRWLVAVEAGQRILQVVVEVQVERLSFPHSLAIKIFCVFDFLMIRL
jgi:hypothetical protein